MAAMGTDQDLTQRMLTCPNLRASQRSLIFNAFAGLPILCAFLMIGTLLFVYFESRPDDILPAHVVNRRELVLPYFISNGLPHNSGLQGLMVAAIFAAAMGSLSSAIGALASTAVTDFYRPFFKSDRTERHYLTAARMFTALFGMLLIIMALACQNVSGSLLWAVFRWVSLVFGGMLGIFLLGVTTRTRGNDRFNVLAMLSSVVLLVGIMLVQQWLTKVYIAWPWWIVLGTVWTYFVAAAAPTRRQT
jgi:Na+/proline symporter